MGDIDYSLWSDDAGERLQALIDYLLSSSPTETKEVPE